MWLIPTKKEVRKEFDKIKDGFKERDIIIEKLRDKQEQTALKVATLEGFILNKSQVSISRSLKPSQETIETRLIKRIKNNKKALVMAELLKLGGSMSVIEMFNNIVLERGLCSKASFYRYVDSLKSQGLEAEKETNEIKPKTSAKRTNDA